MRISPHNATHAIKGTVLLMTFVILTALGAGAQESDKRHVTPVKPETNRVQPPPKGTDEKIIQQYISGDSTAAIQEARKDSLRRVYKRYPRLTDLSIGVNLAEPLFMTFGQSYASARDAQHVEPRAAHSRTGPGLGQERARRHELHLQGQAIALFQDRR